MPKQKDLLDQSENKSVLLLITGWHLSWKVRHGLAVRIDLPRRYLWKWFISAVLGICLAGGGVCAQQSVFQKQHYGVDAGLSHRYVTSILQDQQGFLWMGTKYGLNRFDGKQFKWFTEEENGLQSNEIDHALADASGRLWLFQTGVPHFQAG